MADELTTVCTCGHVFEAQAIRAALEARGLFVHVDGLHHTSMYGGLAAPMILRIMVPRSQLAIARELASEVVGELPPVDDEDDDDEHDEFSPHRRPQPEDLARYGEPIEDEQGEGDEDDEDDDEDEQTALAQRGRHPIAKVLIVSGLGVGVGFVLITAYFGALVSFGVAALIWQLSARE